MLRKGDRNEVQFSLGLMSIFGLTDNRYFLGTLLKQHLA